MTCDCNKPAGYITPFRLCVLQNFPFIEADFDAVTDYELLCKVVEYLNKVISNENNVNAALKEMAEKLNECIKWIDNFDSSYAESIIKQYIATMIFVEITDSGYIVYNIPEKWEDITFNTTGLDISNNVGVGGFDYGHLVLSY